MKTKIFFPVFAAGVLMLSMLACNLGNASGGTPTQAPETPADQTTSTAEATAATAPTESSAETSGACQNPYLPVIVGATWNYNLTGPIPDTFTRSVISVEAGGFTDQDVFGSGVTRQSKWTGDTGSLTALDPGGTSGTVTAENVTANFQTTSTSGVSLPASINSGDTWSQATTIEGIEHIGAQDVPAKNEFTNACTAAGVESITVTAGTFEAMRVECQTTTNITVTVGGNPINTSINFTATSWYAENVGLVKTAVSGGGLDSTIELLSYNIP